MAQMDREDHSITPPPPYAADDSPYDGHETEHIYIEDVFAEFGHGESRPDALLEFFRFVYHEWRSPQLRYVVLLGDGTYDYKNYQDTGVQNHVPRN